ncbi:hypothetical protein GOP47_0026866 [Adiantum capillus-veneris]|nr:hypothetical protein GOP47_0026866 [Adiantum capillus-veneris]
MYQSLQEALQHLQSDLTFDYNTRLKAKQYGGLTIRILKIFKEDLPNEDIMLERYEAQALLDKHKNGISAYAMNLLHFGYGYS